MNKEPSPFSQPLFQVTAEEIASWIKKEHLATKEKSDFEGFELTRNLDNGSFNEKREVTLVVIKKPGAYPQHVHYESDALFFITSGTAVFLSNQEKYKITKGDRIEIPRGMPHGFETSEGETFSSVSIQSPPIRNPHTGKEDFHLISVI